MWQEYFLQIYMEMQFDYMWRRFQQVGTDSSPTTPTLSFVKTTKQRCVCVIDKSLEINVPHTFFFGWRMYHTHTMAGMYNDSMKNSFFCLNFVLLTSFVHLYIHLQCPVSRQMQMRVGQLHLRLKFQIGGNQRISLFKSTTINIV